MLKLMGFFAETEDNGVELDVNIQIKLVFKSLTKEFAGFRAAYNLGNKALTLTQLMKELQFYELMLNGGKSVQEKLDANLAIGSSSSRGKDFNETRSLRDKSLLLRTGDGSYVPVEV
ncbi:hypothetical protein Golax_022568, partial [Gossypium laxum]|nr:hypothetical protein [Gossypium laxum]